MAFWIFGFMIVFGVYYATFGLFVVPYEFKVLNYELFTDFCAFISFDCDR